jgi:hypothetical protein
MRDETKDGIYIFKVRDYTTEIVGRYNKDEGYYYVERGDGTCYKYYPPVEYSCRIMTSRKKGILGSIKHFAQSLSDRSGSIPSDKFKDLASKVFEHVSPSLDINSLERLSPRLNKYGEMYKISMDRNDTGDYVKFSELESLISNPSRIEFMERFVCPTENQP